MKRDEVLRLLGEHRDELQALGVKSLALFGSVARDEAGPGSDVDLLVEFSRPVGMFEFVDLKMYIEALLGARVDLATEDGLKRNMRSNILQNVLKEAIPAA